MCRFLDLTVVVSLMESSILSEVDNTSILRTRLSTPLALHPVIAVLSTG